MPNMTAALERYAKELRKLSPAEVGELSAWLADYQRTLPGSTPPATNAPAAWPDFAARARELFPDGPPVPSFLDTLLEARSPRF